MERSHFQALQICKPGLCFETAEIHTSKSRFAASLARQIWAVVSYTAGSVKCIDFFDSFSCKQPIMEQIEPGISK